MNAPQNRFLLTVSLSLWMIWGASGCSQPIPGPPRFELSGSAKFNGKPIPFGRILLEPDSSQGNTGPAAVADIKNGRYQTRADAGHIGGHFKVTIIGTDGTRPANPDVDNSLFLPFNTTVELPRADGQHDFAVPRIGAQ
ncbi:hypothetical protein M4951_23780 [Blastopirellula sp. J2-11]|uniref:hypothetical protein n=1 Tax=Blastopirellula sp. J2-11 TaxID=2943192 RepID=UPI0021C8E2FF|nr:hypothetical protein [Blastopirellula sp. J2-11]UUO06355.1 hypothetical protein M4951_23780 [Blastopirellula sp. J2-11]